MLNGVYNEDTEENIFIPGQNMIHKIPQNTQDLVKERELA